MEPKFDEIVFLYSLLLREEDCKKFCASYHEDWFDRAECGYVFQEMRHFLKKHLLPPSIKILRVIFKQKDVMIYEARIKEVLDEIENYDKNVDKAEIAWTLDKAQDVATVRAFKQMTEDVGVQRAIEEADGAEILKQINSLQRRFESTTDRKTMNLREAVESLVKSDGFTPMLQRVPTGINIVDIWCGGGLRPKQLGIIVGVTGHGKSACLINIADRMSRNEDRKVWLVTNELSLYETTERMLSRLSGVGLTDIIDAPAMGLGKLSRQWKMNRLDNKFFITEYVRPPISAADIEDEMIRNRNLYGFMPEVIVLDFMERMKPDMSRGRPKIDNEWSNMQFIAQDLVSLAKRHNIIIWTAVQTNRGGASAEELDLTHVQSSIRHIQEATACIALKQRKIVDGDKTGKVGIQFFNLKQRQSKLSFDSVILEADLSKMNITNNVAQVLATDQVDNSGSATPSGTPTVQHAATTSSGMTAQQRKNSKGKYQGRK
jgi:replicative DNA helicase